MFKRISPLLSPAGVSQLHAQLQPLTWEDGKLTAGAAVTRKKNEQLTFQTADARPMLQQIAQVIMNNPEVKYFAQPKRITRIMFSRYGEGMFYGSHNDAPIADGGGQGPGRADVSFTSFLAQPETYEGGDLVLEIPWGEVRIKEPAGNAVFYDTGLMHRVEKVTKGTRLVIVGWLESWVRDPMARAIIRELEDAIQVAAQREFEGEEAVRLRRIRGNLIRRWAG